MATIIELGGGRFIAGDPVDQLPVGYAWCPSCGGSGLEYGYDDVVDVCWHCDGNGVGDRMHPLVPVHTFTLLPDR